MLEEEKVRKKTANNIEKKDYFFKTIFINISVQVQKKELNIFIEYKYSFIFSIKLLLRKIIIDYIIIIILNN